MLERVYTPHLDRDVVLREGTRDRQVWADTFTGLYHVPPASMPAPNTVLDLGANIGLTAAHYGKLWPGALIVPVEMDAGNVEVAELNCPEANVRWEAVCDISGLGRFDSSAAEDSYSLAPNGDRVVICKTLTEILEEEFGEFGGADFVKMDIEGAEWSLFNRPDWAPLVRHLLVELHGPDPVKHAIALLRKAGFRAERHDPHPQAVFAWR